MYHALAAGTAEYTVFHTATTQTLPTDGSDGRTDSDIRGYFMKYKGFTIVELLIVIVVIAILAAITIVAFNGIQQQAANNKTIAAANTWVKALKLYKTDNGRWPSGWVCLGQNYLYGVSGTDTSGTAQCRQTNATGYLVNTSFNNLRTKNTY